MARFNSLYFVPTKIFKFKKQIFSNQFNIACSINKKKTQVNQQKNNKLSILPIERKKKHRVVPLFVFFFCISLFFSFFFNENIKKKNSLSTKIVNADFFLEKSALAKLKSIPVFSITNQTGQPFLIQNKNGEHIGLIFFSYIEALDFSKDMEKSYQATNPFIYVVSLEKAFKMVGQGQTSSGIKDKHGLDYKMKFQFVPEKNQLDFATKLTKKRGISERIPMIPIFTIDGLTIRRGKEKISPMFFTKEDLLSTWNKVRKNDPSLPKNPQIIEGDFIRLILFMRLDGKKEKDLQKIFNFGFIPPSKSVVFAKEEKKAAPYVKMVEFKKVF